MPMGQPRDPRLSEVHKFLTECQARNLLTVSAYKRMCDSILMGDRAIVLVRQQEQEAREAVPAPVPALSDEARADLTDRTSKSERARRSA